MKTDDKIVLRVAEMLDERSVYGSTKYKKPLHRDERTLHEWCTMAQEEMLDGANYLEKIKSLIEDASAFNMPFFATPEVYDTCCGCINKCKDCTDECEPCR